MTILIVIAACSLSVILTLFVQEGAKSGRRFLKAQRERQAMELAALIKKEWEK